MVGRTALLVWLGLTAAWQASGERGTVDPEFEKVPFGEWLEGGGQAQVKWTARIFPAILSVHQRLLMRVEVQLDGVELARRRGQGQVVIFVQLNDEEGRSYQSHGTIELDKVEEGISASNLSYTQYAFVRPGDYRVSFAIFFTVSGEHCVKKEKLHVPPLKKDPMPEAWRDLPPVEFRSDKEPPDLWYLPALDGRLHLPLVTRRPVRLDVIVNLTPSERAAGSLGAQSRNLSSLLPAMKAISQVDLKNGSLDVALLDLTRRRVAFQQENVHELDWERMKDALAETDPATIDVKSLQERKHNARFFVSEVGHRIGSPSTGTGAPMRVVVVLSSAVSFEAGEDLQPIQATPGPDCRVFYIRFHGAAARPVVIAPERSMRPYGVGSPIGRRRRGTPEEARSAGDIDQLEPTLKPIAPRLFDVTTADQFRKALATMLREIAEM